MPNDDPDPDPVEEASRESFPASDSPAWPTDAVSHNQIDHRFEISLGGKVAFLKYTLTDRAITFIHTEVPKQMEGHGIGSKLAKAGLAFARANKLKVVSRCPFVAKYMKQHPEYMDLL